MNKMALQRPPCLAVSFKLIYITLHRLARLKACKYSIALDGRLEEVREAAVLHDQTLRGIRNRNAIIGALIGQHGRRRLIESRLPHGKLGQDAGLFELVKGNQLKYTVQARRGLIVRILDNHDVRLTSNDGEAGEDIAILCQFETVHVMNTPLDGSSTFLRAALPYTGIIPLKSVS
ncbi:hypothetical protein THAOC_13767 [Thalassiosira oceanica]|uniref:Uncharacterized protein n=1 Tax=Thalassiosira oceanica TaxID=159749 RepID=K0SWL5_THAOC|nr:hypothetical protein THAOC_13767 [Thalassiosira oceanica]|eukprot:EJK65376.1 hypothetical protein THAOC_13767 [Thalassiosira oceanica]